MIMKKMRPVCILLLSTVLQLVSGRELFAHGGGAISLSASKTAAGSIVTVRGEKLPANSSVRLELRGALTTVSFGRAAADAEGAFAIQVTIPADAKMGQYAVAAVAADGDVVARADLLVEGGGNGGTSMSGMAGMMKASAEKMDVQVETTLGGWLAIGALILISSGIGLYLLKGTSSWTREV